MSHCFYTLQIDPKILRGVAIEHQHDADEAASLVISEIFPFSSPNSTQPRNKNKTKISGNPHSLKGILVLVSD